MAGSFYTSVQRILGQVNPGVLQIFDSKQTDTDRISFVRDLPYVDSAFQVEASSTSKNPTEARKWRDKGNSLYQEKDYFRSVDCYTKGGHYAPITLEITKENCAVNDEFTIAIANRSAAWYQLRRFDLALQDIDVSLYHGYPESLKYKLYDRKGKCFAELGKYQNAIDAYQELKDYLDKTTVLELKKIKNWRQTCEKQIKYMQDRLSSKESTPLSDAPSENPQERVIKQITKKLNPIPPPVKEPLSTVLPNASDCLEIKYESKYGRFGIAGDDVKVGDCIISEFPYVSVLAQDHFSTRCYHCMKKFESPISCIRCNSVRYCNRECRDASWELYHEYECKLLKLINISGVGHIGHLALRIVMVTGLAELVHFGKRGLSRKGSSELHISTNDDGSYIGGYEALYQLVSHSSKRNYNEKFQYTLLAIYLLKLLMISGFFDVLNERGDSARDRKRVETYVGGVILRFLQIIACNGIEIMETNLLHNVQRSEQVTLGLGLFPTVSLLNHSCNPAMELIFYGNSCIVRAIRNIEEGEELTIDYGYVYYLTEKQQRHLSLKSQYFFECICIACKNNWSLRSKLACGVPTFKCTKCCAPLPMYGGHAHNPGAVQCRKCGYSHKPLTYLQEYQKHTQIFERAVEDAKDGRIDKAFPVLQKILTFMEDFLVLPNKDYVTCLSTLKQCYRSMGNNSNKHLKP